MKHLLKVIVIIASVFALTFLLLKTTGILSVEQIEMWLLKAKELSPMYVIGVVVLLLFADLFVAIPTMTVIALSGYFLDFRYGAIASITGLTLAGISGYWLSNFFGERILDFILRKEKAREEAKETFKKHGVVMILLSRAIPILPEVTACLAGMTKMKFSKFLLVWSLSTIPYVLILTYAGSVSSIENPKPAIYTAIAISAMLWTGWFLFNKKQRNNLIR